MQIYIQYFLNLSFYNVFIFQIILDIINFVKIKILSPNTKSENQNQPQYVLQKYILHTCCENAQSAPPPL